jgi:hypothetical protein
MLSAASPDTTCFRDLEDPAAACTRSKDEEVEIKWTHLFNCKNVTQESRTVIQTVSEFDGV